MDWRALTSSGQLKEIKEFSNKTPIAIFKHSTRCSISTVIKDRLERTWEFGVEKFPIYYLDLLNFRDISNQVATEFSVEHASPQLLVIKNEKSIYNESHMSISVEDLEEFV